MSRILGTLARGSVLVSRANGAQYEYDSLSGVVAFIVAGLGQGERVHLRAWGDDHIVVVFVDAEDNEVTFAEKFRVE